MEVEDEEEEEEEEEKGEDVHYGSEQLNAETSYHPHKLGHE